jgi:hypothetical protein
MLVTVNPSIVNQIFLESSGFSKLTQQQERSAQHGVPPDLTYAETCSTEEKAKPISQLQREGGLHIRPC